MLTFIIFLYFNIIVIIPKQNYFVNAFIFVEEFIRVNSISNIF